ncbi:accessory gene regulator ArgB-like protein [Tepidibacter aestuarii]|uniref:accessory gene regulator ArgB-like protein n=1 Tax=Tepidibacter aestuarii TaxID=2925782 RepID=UPI0020BDFD54|nr:accessory gene regulator B family protein [Tepidibacter aestuarii]CAH2213180.1 accessory gene regulator B [Tepidibacter aestuarii]
MIKKISQYIAALIGKELQNDKSKIDIYSYALEIIIGTILKLTLIILISFILGLLPTTLACLISFIIFRHFGGGVHLSTYNRCLTAGVITFLIMGKLAYINIQINVLITIVIGTFLFGIYSIMKYIPAGTKKKRIIDKNQRLKRKQETFFMLFIWLIVIVILINYKLTAYAFSCVLGALNSFFFITPTGYWVFDTIDNIIDKNKRRWMKNV